VSRFLCGFSMHEMALTESILRLLEEQAAEQSFHKVRTIWLEIGALSTVDPESLRFCFDAIRSGTLAEGAVLEIIALPGQAFCMDCMQTVEVAQRYDPCPVCGSERLQVTGGDSMRVKELEVD